MPSKVRLDSPTTRRAVAAAWRAVERLVGAVPDEQFEAPTRLGDWRVAELVAHLSRNPTFLGQMYAAAQAGGAERPGRPRRRGATYYSNTEPEAEIAERGRREAAGKTAEQLRTELHELTAAALELLDTLPDDALLTDDGRVQTVADYLPSRCVEACVHSLDLAAATGIEPGLDREALGVAVRVLAGDLAARVPGRSVELRIPPYTAVQVVEGPRHTRGTPPNVVEMDGPTWLELATGRITFAEAVTGGRVAASGERADLSAYLPVMA